MMHCGILQAMLQTEQIVAMLVAERDKLNRAIEALQGPVKRRGRPPKNPLAATAAAGVAAPKASPKKRTFSEAQRAAAADRMRKRWAEKKKAEPKKGK